MKVCVYVLNMEELNWVGRNFVQKNTIRTSYVLASKMDKRDSLCWNSDLKIIRIFLPILVLIQR